MTEDNLRCWRANTIQCVSGGLCARRSGRPVLLPGRKRNNSLLQSNKPPLRFTTLSVDESWRGVHRTYLQALTDLNPSTTVLSVDGVGAFDLISPGSLLLERTLCFLSSSRSKAILYRTCQPTKSADAKETSKISAYAFALCIRPAQNPSCSHSHLSEDEQLLAFHDDIYVMSQPESTCEFYGILAKELWAHSRIKTNGCKTQIWNRGGFIPPGHDALLAITLPR